MKIVLPVIVLFFSIHSSLSQTLFSDNFDTDSSANWAVFRGAGTDSVADFAYDYSTNGIPSAPGSGGTTRGLKFNVNQSEGIFQGISASPKGQNFTGNYRMRFDMWLNFVGPMPAGGNGTTQIATFGVGAKGTQVQWAITNPDALEFATSLDGGSADDYRVYSNVTHLAAASGVYAANSRNNSATYYVTNFPGQTVPAAQSAIYPATQNGAAFDGVLAYKWRDVVIEKNGSVVTWTVDGVLIATCGVTATFSTNIFLGMFDSNASSSTEENDFLNMVIFDNLRVESLSGPQIDIVATGDATEGGAAGGFTISRTGDTSSPLTVNFVVSGSAAGGTDYSSIPNPITFSAGQASSNLTVTAINDTVAEFTETVIITISSSGDYIIGTGSATVSIFDNETPELSIVALSPTMYERIADDYSTFRISRKGDLNAAFNANLVYSGTGATNFSGPASVFINSSVVNETFNVNPVDNDVLDGDKLLTVTLGAADGGAYVIGTTNSANTTILDDEYPAETILFSDALDTDTSANWKTNFGANNLVDDYVVAFEYEVAGDGVSNPPNGASKALKLTVNKLDATTNGAAGINLYPNVESFSGDFALRFNMYIAQNNITGTTEFALFGINHSGSKTNWVRQSGTTSFNNPPLDQDGLWYSVTSDASGSAPADFALFTGTNAANTATLLRSAASTAFTQVFKKPPYSPGSAAGAPANIYLSPTPTWADVEVKKIGSLVTMSINKTPVLVYTNTTPFTSGNIMLGYMDPYESIGANGGAVYYSNVRVVSLTVQQPEITGIQLINGGTQVQIDFTGATSDTFKLQSSLLVTGTYADDNSASIIATGAGTYRATTSVSAATQFYRIRRQ